MEREILIKRLEAIDDEIELCNLKQEQQNRDKAYSDNNSEEEGGSEEQDGVELDLFGEDPQQSL